MREGCFSYFDYIRVGLPYSLVHRKAWPGVSREDYWVQGGAADSPAVTTTPHLQEALNQFDIPYTNTYMEFMSIRHVCG